MKNETGIAKNRIIAELTRSSHGDLSQYVPTGRAAASEDPEFFGHLLSWNRVKGAIRDSKVALPVLALFGVGKDSALRENALAHVASLDPRNLVRAVRFSMSFDKSGFGRQVKRVVERYLRERESVWPWWERAALQHRQSMKELYALLHVKPCDMANKILFKSDYPKGTAFDVVKRLPTMSPSEAAREISEKRIPFLVAIGALGAKAKEPDTLMAVVERMSASEVTTNMATLEKLGVKSTPALRSALEAALARVQDSTANVLKTTKASRAVKDKKTKERLVGVQEKQLDKASIDGDWLILADKSSSMRNSIAVSNQIAATLARLVSGSVGVVFFDTAARGFDFTGKSLDEITEATKRIADSGYTSIGVGLDAALRNGWGIDGIVIVSDGGENTPPRFVDAYAKMQKELGKDVPVYFYVVTGESPEAFIDQCASRGIDVQIFDLRGENVDYYSLPNLAMTMRTNRHSLVDEIYAAPLLTMAEVFRSRGLDGRT